MRVKSVVLDEVRARNPSAAHVLEAINRVLSPNGSFNHYPIALRVFGLEYEEGLKHLVDSGVVLVKAGLYRLNPAALDQLN